MYRIKHRDGLYQVEWKQYSKWHLVAVDFITKAQALTYLHNIDTREWRWDE